MKIINKGRIPVKMWLDEIESSAIDQAVNLANLPFSFKHIAIMPDSHVGYGMPIGGVMATEGVVIPNAVGVDIGCGMCAVKTSLTEISTEDLKKIMSSIRKVVPVGFSKQEKSQEKSFLHLMEGNVIGNIALQEIEKAKFQIGTLGGGNHFIEIQKGSDGFIWIMIHSGSRNVGLQVASYYNQLAIEMNEKWKTAVPKAWELAFLPLESNEGQQYLEEMKWCVEFALANRKLMMNNILQCFGDVLKLNTLFETVKLVGPYLGNGNMEYEQMINIAHNYASMENHFGQNVLVHRKGATLAREGTIGIIPGSQGTSSYIVKGLGNKESFESCSHGAGRKLSRSRARKELNLEEETKSLDEKGIIHAIRSASQLDEAPGAYKDINVVMENQKDLVVPLVELKPLAVIKG